MLDGHVVSANGVSGEDEGSSMLSSFKTLALATSAKRPERKSELYEEIFTAEPSSLFRSLRFLFFRSVKRTFLDEDTVVASIALEAEKS